MKKKVYAFVLLSLAILILSSCSMQKSSSKANTAHVDRTSKSVETVTPSDIFQDRAPVKVDYMTPVCEIKYPELYVYKEKRKLYIIQTNVLVRDYPIGLGFRPKGDKEKMGDGRTPEGDFFICVKNPSSRFVKSLGLSYPDKRHAERAFFSGTIGIPDFREILIAHENRAKPPWNTPLGGEIFIHAGGAHKDWTNGCIALYDSDMEELFQIADVGTPVSVRP